MYPINIFWLSFLLLFFSACEANLADPPEILRNSPSFGLRTDLKYADTTELRNLTFNVGQQPTADRIAYLFTSVNISTRELGNTLTVEGRHTDLIPRERYLVQFWANDFPEDRQWTADEIASFFYPDKSFAFGQGEGMVDIMFLLPSRNVVDNSLSRSSYLENPQGTLVVESVEDFNYTLYGLYPGPYESYGKLITCSFNGQVGRYDGLADQADGDPDFYQTDEVVELIDGKVTFYLEYERI